MIKIAIADLREFKNRSAKIKPNTILPILAYIKLEFKNSKATLTKSSLNAFIQHQLKVKSKKEGVILLDTKTLFSLVDSSSGEEITIEVDGKKVILDDGATKVRFQAMDADTFPAVPENNAEEKFVFSQETIEALHLSKVNTDAASPNQFFSHIHMYSKGKTNYIFGTNSTVIYYRQFSDKLPSISLDRESVDIITSYKEVVYTSSGNYNFFDTGNSLYAFIKVDFKASDITTIIAGNSDEVNFKFERKKMIEFCNLILSLDPSRVTYLCIEDAGKKSIALRFSNTDVDLSADRFYEVEKNATIKESWFSAGNMVNLLKDLPYDELDFNFTKGNLYFKTSEDADFTGVIREIQFQN